MGVQWLWVVEPAERTLEVRHLAAGQWTVHGIFGDEARVRLPPFEAIEIPLARLWQVGDPQP